MSKIVVVGSLNMDLVTNTKNMPKIGETIVGDSFRQIPGGKGANQAVAIARLGGAVGMIGKVGDDSFGETLRNALMHDNVDTKYVFKENDCSTGVAAITVDSQANNAIIVIPGANFKITKEDIDHSLDMIHGAETIVTQLEVPIDVVHYSLLKAKEAGKYTILNPAPAQYLEDEIIGNVDLLIPNETELEILAGMEIKNEEDILAAARKLMAKGVKQLIVTLGEKGSIYLAEQGVQRFKAYKVKAVDTTAAGDSFVGALAVALSNKLEMTQAIDFASKVGALTVTKFGAQSSLPFKDDITHFEGDLV
ncbi:ribokinase [Anaerosolibacter carboniphilus]|uniref:Ribokinase n=1 Tax=Anaerosolibacter carboniphilus TaxID=1417629 RepID=A0A841L0K4_9FIRM|nr:ribokinase [Anaerosolibacter carboniphilus]MBB6215919.1 ribokinase [Anaerosolibacter carboniphilus]